MTLPHAEIKDTLVDIGIDRREIMLPRNPDTDAFWQAFRRHAGLDHDNYVVGSFGDSPAMAAEIEASGGTALGIEVDVRDHESVEAMVADRRTVSYSCAPSDGPRGATAVPSASGGGRSGLHLRRRQLACGGAYIFRGRNGAHIRCDPNPSGSGWWRERATIAADDTAKLAGLHRGSGDGLATYLPRY